MGVSPYRDAFGNAISKLKKYNLEDEALELRKNGRSFDEIASELNRHPNIKGQDTLDKFVVKRFLDSIPEPQQQLLEIDKEKFLANSYKNFDIIQETMDLFNRANEHLRREEEHISKTNGRIQSSTFRNYAEVMATFLNQLTALRKEAVEYANIKKFVELVFTVLEEECPDKIPKIVERLKLSKGTSWFTTIAKDRDFKSED